MNFDKCLHLYNHYYHKNIEHFYNLEKFPHAPSQSIPYISGPRQPLICFLSLQITFASSGISSNGNLQHMLFCVCLLSLNIFLKFIHIVACISSLFLFITE